MINSAWQKPPDMFDRKREWAALTRFVADDTPGASLGVVSGRRRQGKTYLLRALTEAAGGFYFAAEEATDAESLRYLGDSLAEYLRAPAPFVFPNWRTAIDALLGLGSERQIPVVIDEFPYLARANTALPSIVQNALAPLRAERDASKARLLLCGSAMSFMGTLLSRGAPLRGRASLELTVSAFNHQVAADFWGIEDPHLAILVNAVVGGTPAYRREFIRGDVPDSPEDFDAWVERAVLNPASPLFREGRYLLADDPELHDTALYHSILAGIAYGNTTRGKLATYLGRKSGDLTYPLSVLSDAGYIATDVDALRAKRTFFRITEPLINFYHAIMRPIWSDLEHVDNPHHLWKQSNQRFNAQVMGPHFEHLCRLWTRYTAPAALIGGTPTHVGATVVNDPASKSTHQLDVVVRGGSDDGASPLLMIGEVKWGEIMDVSHLDRLRHIRELLALKGITGARDAKLACYSAAGFTDNLRTEARDGEETVLISASDLYT